MRSIYIPVMLIVYCSLLYPDVYGQVKNDTIINKIYFASGFNESNVEISINSEIIGSNVYLKSNNIYGLSDFEITLSERGGCKKINAYTSQGVFKLKRKRVMVLKLVSENIKFEYSLYGREKYLVVSKQDETIYVTQFKEEPGFD